MISRAEALHQRQLAMIPCQIMRDLCNYITQDTQL